MGDPRFPELKREDRAELQWWGIRYHELQGVRAYWPLLEVSLVILGVQTAPQHLYALGAMLTSRLLRDAFLGEESAAIKDATILTEELQEHLAAIGPLLEEVRSPEGDRREELVPHIMTPKPWTELGPQLSLYWPGPYGRGGSGAGHVLLCPPSRAFEQLIIHPDGPKPLKEITS